MKQAALKRKSTAANRGFFSRGQLVSADAVIAIAVIAVVAGFATSSAQAALAAGAKHAEISSTLADAIAASVAEGIELKTLPAHCLRYSNGTDGCAGFECPADVFSSRRMVGCGGRACLLEVLACE